MRWNLEEITKQREEYYHQLLYLGHHSGVKPEFNRMGKFKNFISRLVKSQQGTDILWDVLKHQVCFDVKICLQLNFQRVSKAHCLGEIMDPGSATLILDEPLQQ